MFKNLPKLPHLLLPILLTFFLLFLSGNSFAQTCSGCTQTISNSNQWDNITVNSSQTLCVPNGVTFYGQVTLATGGKICVAAGATFSPNSSSHFNGIVTNYGNINLTIWNGNHSGKIINHGNFNSNGFNGNFTGTIENHNQLTMSQIQNFAGKIENFGQFTNDGQQFVMVSGASIINRGNINLRNISSTDAKIVNYNSFIVNNGFILKGSNSLLDNKINATLDINMTNGQTEIQGEFDNSGTVNIKNATSGQAISALVFNYNKMVFHGAARFGIATYLINDNLLEFRNFSQDQEIQFQGPLLQNNGELHVYNGAKLKFENDESRLHNNNLIVIENGDIIHTANGSTIVNNCKITARNYILTGGTSYNNGYIHSNGSGSNHGKLELNGSNTNFVNAPTGYVRANNLILSGHIKGEGQFLFTGNTNINTQGSFIGSNASNFINVYDSSSPANAHTVFDIVPWNYNPSANKIQWYPNMQVLNSSDYTCTAPATTAGYPPTTEDLNYSSSTPGIAVIPLTGHAFPHSDVNGQPFTLMYNSIRLFEFGNPNNSTNNSTTLVIPGKGTFTVNADNGEIIFTPEADFTNGTVVAEYRMSNKWSGTPPVHPGSRKKITISFNTISTVCYKDPNTDEPADTFTSTGVSTLSETTKGWPATVPNGYLALESKDKGFVITRVPNENSITQPKEGMLIYDIQARCVKLHNGTDWRCIQKKCD